MMPPKIDLTGKVFNKWRVEKWSHEKKVPNGSRQFWDCICKCGTEKKVFSGNLTNSRSKSCGCHIPNGRNQYGRYGKSADEPECVYEYVPICKGRIDYMLKSCPDYFDPETTMSLFETFFHTAYFDNSKYRATKEAECNDSKN